MKEKEICVYCGESANTEDHVPPKNLFPKGMGPKKFIKVPSCYKCNHSFSLNEEWFRLFVCSMAEENSFYARQIFYSEIKRSIWKKPQIAFRLQRQMKSVGISTKSGLYLGKKTLIKLTEDDLRRFRNVLDKYVKGLVFYEFKDVLPREYNIKHNIFLPEERISDIMPRTKDFKWKIIHKDVFRYGFGFVPGSYKSVWITVFYNSVICESLVFRKEDIKDLENLNKATS